MKIEKTTDILIVGSSPVCLIQALHYQQQGRSVLIVDKNSEVGGAWRSVSVGKVSNLDVGCHIIDRNKSVNLFLKKHFDINMEVVKPFPITVFNKEMYASEPASLKVKLFAQNTKNILLQIFEATKEPNLSMTTRLRRILVYCFRIMKHIRTTSIKLIKSDNEFYYPKDGTSELIEKIKSKFTPGATDILLQEKIESININSTGGTAITAQSKITFKKVVLTPSSEVGVIKSLQKTIMPLHEQKLWRHMVLVVEDSERNSLTYGTFINHRLIFRISECTKFAHYPALGCRVILIELARDLEFSSKENLSVELLDELKALDIVDKEASLIEYNLLYYKEMTKDKGTLKELEESFPDIIQGLYIGSLAHGINVNMKKWNF